MRGFWYTFGPTAWVLLAIAVIAVPLFAIRWLIAHWASLGLDAVIATRSVQAAGEMVTLAAGIAVLVAFVVLFIIGRVQRMTHGAGIFDDDDRG